MNNSAREITLIAKEDTPLLKFVRESLPDVPYGTLKAYLKHRQIAVDRVITTKFDFPVKAGQSVSISKAGTKERATELEILYEDDALIAVNKPAGLLSVASDTEKERTAYRALKPGREGELFVVHRLDRDTSGVLLFAKSREIRDALQKDWEQNVRREYLAVCEGIFENKQGRCDTYLHENSIHKVYSGDSLNGKRAITDYTVQRENESYSFLKIIINTGRKNQIRVHMSELGHPVVGDKKYGASGNPLGRLGLHASRLEIVHPTSGKPVKFFAKPPRRFTLPRVTKKK